MKYLHKYVPTAQDGRPYPILCHGNQLSVEKMVDPKLSMAFSENEADQLKGLIPRPQGFHKRCIVLQDSMNSLFSGNTVGDKGSLFHIKKQVRVSFCKEENIRLYKFMCRFFFNFVTEAIVCLIVCNILDMDNIDDVCQTIPTDKEAVQNLFMNICEQVINLVWPHIDRQSIQQAITGDGNQLEQESISDTEDAKFLDDTILYWNEDSYLDETLPYCEENEYDFFGNEYEHFDINLIIHDFTIYMISTCISYFQ